MRTARLILIVVAFTCIGWGFGINMLAQGQVSNAVLQERMNAVVSMIDNQANEIDKIRNADAVYRVEVQGRLTNLESSSEMQSRMLEMILGTLIALVLERIFSWKKTKAG